MLIVAEKRGGIHMKNFISVIRTDRLREMQFYEQKAYSFVDKKNYIMIEKIHTMQEGYKFEFGIEVTQNDVYFYLIEEKANAYLSIMELYHLLYAIGRQEGMEFVTSALKRQLRIQIKKAEEKILNQEKFVYRNLEYEIRKTVALKRDAAVKISDIALTVSYCELFMLLNLIQEKREQVLCGWNFADDDRFLFFEIPEEQRTERGKRKYYLTKTEYKNILK